MTTEILRSKHGYDIPCLSHFTGSHQGVILCHGFGSSKASPTTTALQSALAQQGIDSLCFDWPAHGDSPADGTALRVDCCLDDLAVVEAHVLNRLLHGEIGYFASSFGAYLTLAYLYTRPHQGQRAFLRSAAVDMAGIFQGWLDTPLGVQMAAKGFVMLGQSMGYARELKVTQGLVDDFAAFDLFQLCRPHQLPIAMVHGAADSVASPQKATAFAQLSGATLHLLPGAEHRLMGPGELDAVLEEATAFFRNSTSNSRISP